jgi:Phage integrase family
MRPTSCGAEASAPRLPDLGRVRATAAGLVTYVTFHALRHHYASLLIGAGCSVKAVQEALGHATAAETWTPTATSGPPTRTAPGTPSTPLTGPSETPYRPRALSDRTNPQVDVVRRRVGL